MRKKDNSMIVIETKKRKKFGAFFSERIDFTNGVTESHSGKRAFLFNLTNEKIFPY